MGAVLQHMEDYKGTLDYYQQALRASEKVLGKTHPDTLGTIMNMAKAYQVGLKDFTKAEEMYRLALDGFEKSLGKNHEDTKMCARNLAILPRELAKRHPHILTDNEDWGIRYGSVEGRGMNCTDLLRGERK